MGILDFTIQPSTGNPQLDYQRTMARALQEQQAGTDTSPIRSGWQGAARLAQALMGGLDERAANQAAAQQTQALTSLLGGQQQPLGAAASTPQVSSYAPADNASSFVQPQANTAPSSAQDAIRANAVANGQTPGYQMPEGYWNRLVQVESGGDPNNVTGSNIGLAQFAPSDMASYGLKGADPRDPQVAQLATQREAAANTAAFQNRFGRDPSPGELYLMHQQGQAGGLALMSNPTMPAAQAIQRFYSSPDVAAKAISGNMGDPNAPAGDFANQWISRFEKAPASSSGVAAINANMPQSGTPAPSQGQRLGAALQNGPVQTQGVNPQLLALALSPASPPQVQQMAGMMLQTQMAPKNDFITRPDGSVVMVNKLSGASQVVQGPMRQPTWGVISENADGSKRYGWINPLDQSITQGPNQGVMTPPPNPATASNAPSVSPVSAPAGVTSSPLAPLPDAASQQPNSAADSKTPLGTNLAQQAQQAAPNQQPANAQANPDTAQKVTVPRMPGESYLDNVANDPQWGPYVAQARAILRGDAPVPTGNAATKGVDQAIMRLVYAADPSFNAAVAASRAQSIKDFQNGDSASSAGGMITNANTALAHLKAAAEASEALGKQQIATPFNGRGGSGAINSLQDYLWPADSNYKTAASKYKAIVGPAIEELTKFYSGSSGTQAERDAQAAILDPTTSPQQRRAAFQVLVHGLESKGTELQRKWHQSMGPGAADYPIFGPEAQGAMTYIRGLGQTAHGAPGVHIDTSKPGNYVYNPATGQLEPH